MQRKLSRSELWDEFVRQNLQFVAKLTVEPPYVAIADNDMSPPTGFRRVDFDDGWNWLQDRGCGVYKSHYGFLKIMSL